MKPTIFHVTLLDISIKPPTHTVHNEESTYSGNVRRVDGRRRVSQRATLKRLVTLNLCAQHSILVRCAEPTFYPNNKTSVFISTLSLVVTAVRKQSQHSAYCACAIESNGHTNNNIKRGECFSIRFIYSKSLAFLHLPVLLSKFQDNQRWTTVV